MEYVYAAMLLHSSGADLDAKSITKVLKSAGVSADKARVEALVASLEGVDIEDAMSSAAVAPAAAAPAAPAASDASDAAEAKEEKEEEEEEVSEEDAAAGLGALFG